MPPQDPLSTARQARAADRYYGFFLLALALASAAAPMFIDATLPWTLFLAGIIGAAWLMLDRSPRGFLAAAGWALVALVMGFQLVFHLFLHAVSIGSLLGLGFLLLGAAEILFGVERYRPGGSRYALIAGGAVAAVFGVFLPTFAPNLPAWAGGLVMAAMFTGFGVALLFGAARGGLESTPDES